MKWDSVSSAPRGQVSRGIFLPFAVIPQTMIAPHLRQRSMPVTVTRSHPRPARTAYSDGVAFLRRLCCGFIALALVRAGGRERRRRRQRIEIPFLHELFHLFVFCLQTGSREPNPQANATSTSIMRLRALLDPGQTTPAGSFSSFPGNRKSAQV